MIFRDTCVSLCLALVFAATRQSDAQHAIGAAAARPAPSDFVVASGIDTVAPAQRTIIDVLRTHLRRVGNTTVGPRTWSTATEIDRVYGDVTAGLTRSRPSTLLSLTFEGANRDRARLQLRHGTERTTAVHQTLYAVKQRWDTSTWQLAGALAPRTAAWTRRTAGRITFVYAPGQVPNRTRAAHAAAFVDSVARLFDVPVPPNTLYYVTGSPAEYFRALGLDSMPSDSASREPGGMAIRASDTGDGLVFAGDPRQGEAYLHELSHAVLGGSFGSAFVSEAVATWLGGSRALPASQLYADLARFQRQHPALSLTELLKGTSDVRAAREWLTMQKATGALSVGQVYRRDGVAGLRALRNRTSMGDAEWLMTQLRLPPGDAGALNRWWRSATRAAVLGTAAIGGVSK